MSMDRLDIMFGMQRELQFIKGHDFPTMTPPEQMAFIEECGLGAITELGEALAETGWKPWASSNHINRPAYLRELVDTWHMLMNLMLVAGLGPDDLYADYIEKNKVNRRRFTEGYDGVTAKCPACKRQYGEPGVQCTPADPGWSPRDHTNDKVRGPWCHELYPDGPASPPVADVFIRTDGEW